MGFHTEIGHFPLRRFRLLLLVLRLLLHLGLVLGQLLPISRLLEVLPVVVLVLLLPNAQLVLNLGNESGNFLLGNDILLQNMRVLLVQLISSLVGIRMQHQFLQKNCVNFLLRIGCLLLVVHSYYGRFVSDAETWVIRALPR